VSERSERVVLSVPGMSCAHCEQAVRQELERVAGVAAVAVDLQTKDVTVTGTDLDRRALVDAVDAAGYDVAG
jgi:copper chaperone